MSMQRKPFVKRFAFSESTNGTTEDGQPLDFSQFAFVGLHVDSGLDGRTINFFDNGVWGSHLVLSKSLTAGFVALNQNDLLAIGPSMQLTATLDEPATGNCWLKAKS